MLKKRSAGMERMKRIARFLRLALLGLLLLTLGKALLWGRWTATPLELPKRVEITWAEAMADGALAPEEIAAHYAPEINAAVNVLLSESGKGDFLTAVDFDGDWSAMNNWENMTAYPLLATVYYSVQETDTHYFVGYYFYHPRDDAEIWLDRHENDMEGIMLAVPKAADGFAQPEMMYTQGHGYVPFYFNGDHAMTEGSRRGGTLLLEGDRPVVYITPNGTLNSAGHSVESAADNSTYWSVGHSGVRYYHGGLAQEPATFKGDYQRNRCSYKLESLDVLWLRRTGPYGNMATFGDYGAFRGDNYRANAANPPWGWRNKTIYGYGGSFLSDPAWTISRAVEGMTLSCNYLVNPYADWKITVTEVESPEADFTLRLSRDGWVVSDAAWWRFEQRDGVWRVTIADDVRQSLWCAAPRGTHWRLEVIRPDGSVIPGARVEWTKEYMN